MTCDSLIAYFAAQPYVGDTIFSYPGNEECWIGSTNNIFYDCDLNPITHGETHFWAGCGCDIHNGTDFLSARELFEAPIYGGKSIRDRWDEITWHEINGCWSPEEFDARMEKDRR